MIVPLIKQTSASIIRLFLLSKSLCIVSIRLSEEPTFISLTVSVWCSVCTLMEAELGLGVEHGDLGTCNNETLSISGNNNPINYYYD